jgi:hypothetical protein
VLKGVPLKEPTNQSSLGFIRRVFGYSALANVFFKKVALNWWYGTSGNKFPEKYVTDYSPTEISCLILKKIKMLGLQHQFLPIIVAQDYWQDRNRGYTVDEEKNEVISCAQELHLKVLESEKWLKPIFEADGDEYETLFVSRNHMSNRGNLITAKKVADMIRPQ